MMGFCKTRLSVCKLNQHIVQCLVDHGVPAISMPACGTWVTAGGAVIKDGMDNICEMLQQGFIPCLHGDCVLDQSQGCRILSGDTIIQRMCGVLQPSRVIFLTDVPGMFTKPPSESGAELIPLIKVAEEGELSLHMDTSTTGHDVTGGIKLKLDCATNIVSHCKGCTSVVICAGQDDAYGQACRTGNLAGKPGTLIEYSP